MAALQRVCICKMTPASRSARGIMLTVSEPGRRVYQSRGFVCKQMHVPSRQTKLILTMPGFPMLAWRYQSIRRTSDKKPNDARDKRGRLHLKVVLLISFQFILFVIFGFLFRRILFYLPFC